MPEADPVILDRDVEGNVLRRQGHVDVASARVPGDVAQRLLHDAEADGLDLYRRPRVGRRDSEGGAHPGALPVARHEEPQRPDQTKLVERRRAELEGERLHLLDHLLDGPHALGHARARGGRELALDRLEVQRDGDERLPELVVQLAGERAALVLLLLQETARQRAVAFL